MLRKTWFAAVLGAALMTAASAAEEPQRAAGGYKVLGGGVLVRCGTFVSEMDKGPAADLVLGITVIAWVQGYLTAYNETLAKSPEVAGDLANGMSEPEVINLVADYCSSHPDDLIATAAREVVTDLFRDASNRALREPED